MKKPLSATDVTAEQQCRLPNLNFVLLAFAILYVAGMIFYVHRHEWPSLILWLVLLPCARWVGLRLYPLTSQWRGGGSVADKLPASVRSTQAEVTFYSHSGCPFCPIVKRRLKALQDQMGFALKEIDITFSPRVAASKAIRSVPVVEVGNQRVFGNATSQQLAELIARTKVPGVSLPA